MAALGGTVVVLDISAEPDLTNFFPKLAFGLKNVITLWCLINGGVQIVGGGNFLKI